jgi:hypothetical protein
MTPEFIEKARLTEDEVASLSNLIKEWNRATLAIDLRTIHPLVEVHQDLNYSKKLEFSKSLWMDKASEAQLEIEKILEKARKRLPRDQHLSATFCTLTNRITLRHSVLIEWESK